MEVGGSSPGRWVFRRARRGSRQGGWCEKHDAAPRRGPPDLLGATEQLGSGRGEPGAVEGSGAGELGRLGWGWGLVLWLGEGRGGPELVAQGEGDRGDQDAAHQEGVEEDAEGDYEADLGEKGKRQHGEHREGAGEDDAGAGDDTAGDGES